MQQDAHRALHTHTQRGREIEKGEEEVVASRCNPSHKTHHAAEGRGREGEREKVGVRVDTDREIAWSLKSS